MRQLAAVVLKHFVHADWLRLAEAEKACVRAALPAGLRDGHGRIRTAVSVVIAAVARTDWPDAWPTLLADLTLPLEEAGLGRLQFLLLHLFCGLLPFAQLSEH